MLSIATSPPAISLATNTGFDTAMDVRTIRRANLAALVRAHHGNKALADAIDTDPAYISQLLSTKTKADMGHNLARRIEQALGLPGGWMDQVHSAETRVAEKAAPFGDTRARLYPLISWVQAGDWTDIAENLSPATLCPMSALVLVLSSWLM